MSFSSSANEDESRANALVFRDLAEILERIEGESRREAKMRLIFRGPKFQQHFAGQTQFPYFRLVVPSLDRERNVYHLKVEKLAMLYVIGLGLKDQKDTNEAAKRILGWKNPAMKNHLSSSVGDIALVVHDVLEHRGQSKSVGLTIGEINELLDMLSSKESQREEAAELKRKAITRFIRECSPLENKWLIRIVLKDMKMGIREESFLREFHPDAADAYNVHSDLRRLCSELRDKTMRKVQSLEIFTPFAPMLAKSKPANTITSGMGDFCIEPKIDGERMLCHIDADARRLVLFTRNGTDYTDHYGPILQQHIFSCLSPDVRRVIFDGEIVAWDGNLDAPIPFGQNRTIAAEEVLHISKKKGSSRHVNESDDQLRRWMTYFVFDLVFLDTTTSIRSPPIASQTLSNRQNMLRSVLVKQIPKHLEILSSRPVVQKEREQRHRAVMEALDNAISLGWEGLVVKDLSSPYMNGETGRKKEHWVKVKPDHIHALSSEIDVIIIGGYLGEGRRAQTMKPTQFLLAVAESSKKQVRITNKNGEEEEEDDDFDGNYPTQFYTFAKVGTGYSYEELSQLQSRLEKHWNKPFDPKNPPAFLKKWTPKKDEIPDFWIHPRNSVILEVTAGEIMAVDSMSTGYTLRFPRVKRIRYDKQWTECMTFDSLLEMVDKFKGSVHNKKRATDLSVHELAPQKKRKAGAKTMLLRNGVGAAQLGVVPHMKGSDLRGILAENELFKGLEFFVFPGEYHQVKYRPPGERTFPNDGFKIKEKLIKSKADLEILIKKHGGLVMAVQTPKTSVIISASLECDNGANRMKLENIVRQGKLDVLKPTWVADCIEKQSIVKREYGHYISMKPETLEAFKSELDKFGDHRTQPVDSATLTKILEKISAKAGDFETSLESLLSDQHDPLLFDGNWLRGTCLYFDQSSPVRVAPSLAQIIGDYGIEHHYFTAVLPTLDIPKLIAQLYGAEVLDELTEKVTHVIMDPLDTSRLGEYRDLFKRMRTEISMRDGVFRERSILDQSWVFQVTRKDRTDWHFVETAEFDMVKIVSAKESKQRREEKEASLQSQLDGLEWV